MARVVLVGVAHHLTQRAIDRRQIFFDNADFETYIKVVTTCAHRSQTKILGYCLMPNHVHWVVVPELEDSLALTFREAHSRYSVYANAKFDRSGHLWQNRFFSCPMDQTHLWAAMRYVERNPVRARMVAEAAEYRWSSAAAHSGLTNPPQWLAPEPFASTFSNREWTILLRAETSAEADLELRRNTHTGRPLGSLQFVKSAEARLGRKLAASEGGRPSIRSKLYATAG